MTDGPFAEFTIHDDEIGPTLVHDCVWYCTISGCSLADVIAIAEAHTATHATGNGSS
jgi:hypothetical protein